MAVLTLQTPVAPADRYATAESPIGPLRLIGNGRQLMALGFNPDSPVPAGLSRDDSAFATVSAQLREYFDGTREAFDLDLAPIGAPFALRVWSALLTIPYGMTCSYGDIAGQLGTPGASRAVGSANNANPIAVIVPCHRVIGADGSMTGYAGGIAVKHHLLSLEGPTLF